MVNVDKYTSPMDPMGNKCMNFGLVSYHDDSVFPHNFKEKIGFS